MANLPRVIVREYRGRAQSDAISAFEADAQALAAEGYLPVSQSWAYGQWTPAQVVVAIVTIVVVIGFFLVALMLISKPDGSLVVTYVRRDA